MSRPNHTLVITRATPHCTENGCRKCISRSHWFRRRGWRFRAGR